MQNRFSKYAQPADPITKAADPTLGYKTIEAKNNADASGYVPTIKAGEAAKTPYEVQKAALENENIRLQMQLKREEAERARIKAEEDGKKPDPTADSRRALQDQLDRVSLLYGNGIKGGAPNWLMGNLPDAWNDANASFNTAAQGLANPFMAAFRTPGAGSQSDTELKQFMAANTPEASDSDATITEKIRNIQTRLGGDKMDASTALIAGPGGGGQPALAQGVKDEVDPILKGVAARVGSMIANPATTDAQIIDFLKKNGVDPANTSIAEPLQYRKTPGFKAWQRKNPGAPYPVGPNFYTKQVPLRPIQNLGNTAAQSAPGAFAIGAAQGVSGNRLDNFANLMGGDGEAINTAMELSRANSPGASFAGDLSGQALAQYGLSRIPGFSRLPNSMPGRVAEDAIYGAYAGSGDEDVGALSGALTNVTGGAIGRGAAKVGKSALTGITNPSLSYLNDANVPLTIGRIGRGSGGKIGDTIGGLEERAAGLPVFDAIINSARQRGDEGFNREMFRQIGEPVGVPGNGSIGVDGLIDARQTRNGAYSFLDPMRLSRDAEYEAGKAALDATLPNLPEYGGQVSRKLGLIDGAFDADGGMTGRRWQDSIRSIRSDVGSLRGKEFGNEAADALTQAEGNLSGLVTRQVEGGNEALANANRVNANYKTAQASLKGRVAQRNGVLTDPTTLNAASIDGARRFGGIDSALEGKRPFYSLSKAGMEVMPNLTPDSGTAGRSLLYASLPTLVGGSAGAAYGGASEDMSAGQGAGAGAGIGAASTILPTLALMALYSKGGQKGIQKLMLGKRPSGFEAISKGLNAPNPFAKAGRSLLSSRTAGNVGSASLRDLLLYSELDPNNP